jgi:hypothetical protein
MIPAQDVIAERLVNVLVRDAQPKGLGKSWFLRPTIAHFRAFHKGLWVGGNAYLTSSSLEFRPNALNRALHEGDLSRLIVLKSVLEVTDRFGVATRIVDITCRNDEGLTFRCYGAREFADQIRGQVDRLKQEANPASLQ